ncbi:cellulose biosynthesis protein BcsQ [Bradyrhizobium betae]|nr:cellulose biosynthesis protein BcsQ [Bradyrhizobium betae]
MLSCPLTARRSCLRFLAYARDDEHPAGGWLARHQELGEIVDAFLGYRVDYQDSALRGLGVTKYHPHGEAAREVRRVTDWLLSQLEWMP